MSEDYKCPRCGRAFKTSGGLAVHRGWCEEDNSERRRKISQNHADVSGSNHPLYGKHHSAETRARMSKALRGNQHSLGNRHSPETLRKMSEAQSGNRHPNYGKHLSVTTRQKISMALSQGGPFPYGPMWPMQRDRARARDNYTCQRCGITEQEMGHELSIHHIRPFRESNDHTLENLICLCHTLDNGCHTHCEHHPEDCPEPRKHWLLK